MLAGGDPVPLGGGVDLEDVGPGAEDRLLPGEGNIGKPSSWLRTLTPPPPWITSYDIPKNTLS